MKLQELIDALKAVEKQDADVVFDFCGCNPTTLDSYRGFYDQLALGFGVPRDVATVSVDELVKRLEAAVGETFTGWKGGDYRMSETTEVWVDNHGYCYGTAISGVDDRGFQVVLETYYRDH